MKKLIFISALLVCSMGFVSAQSLLTGTILSESGDPLPGATVEIIDLN